MTRKRTAQRSVALQIWGGLVVISAVLPPLFAWETTSGHGLAVSVSSDMDQQEAADAAKAAETRPSVKSMATLTLGIVGGVALLAFGAAFILLGKSRAVLGIAVYNAMLFLGYLLIFSAAFAAGRSALVVFASGLHCIVFAVTFGLIRGRDLELAGNLMIVNGVTGAGLIVFPILLGLKLQQFHDWERQTAQAA